MKHFTRHPSKVTAATDILSFKCPGCKNKTLYSAEQDVHRAADVDENELFICDECGGEFRAHPQFDGSIRFTESIESATSADGEKIDRRLSSTSKRYKGYRISLDTRYECYNIYDAHGELEDHGFRSVEDAMAHIDELVSIESATDAHEIPEFNDWLYDKYGYGDTDLTDDDWEQYHAEYLKETGLDKYMKYMNGNLYSATSVHGSSEPSEDDWNEFYDLEEQISAVVHSVGGDLDDFQGDIQHDSDMDDCLILEFDTATDKRGSRFDKKVQRALKDFLKTSRFDSIQEVRCDPKSNPEWAPDNYQSYRVRIVAYRSPKHINGTSQSRYRGRNVYSSKQSGIRRKSTHCPVTAAKKRIARIGEWDNGHVIRDDWRSMSPEDAEEEARKQSLKDPEGTYYVAYDDVMNPCSPYSWKNGKRLESSTCISNGTCRETAVKSSSAADPADYEDDIQEISQEFTSENTSINSSKLPAIFKMVTFQPGTINIDYGGGRFDNVADYLTQFDVINLVYDPYNRTPEHNKDVIRTVRKAGGADTATCSNVLNVIKEPEVRQNVLQNIKKLVKPNGTVYITVYEGSGKGNEGPTKSGYQLNRKTEGYLDEIKQVFPDAVRKGKLIVAHPNGSADSSVESATDVSKRYRRFPTEANVTAASDNIKYSKRLLQKIGENVAWWVVRELSNTTHQSWAEAEDTVHVVSSTATGNNVTVVLEVSGQQYSGSVVPKERVTERDTWGQSIYVIQPIFKEIMKQLHGAQTVTSAEDLSYDALTCEDCIYDLWTLVQDDSGEWVRDDKIDTYDDYATARHEASALAKDTPCQLVEVGPDGPLVAWTSRLPEKRLPSRYWEPEDDRTDDEKYQAWADTGAVPNYDEDEDIESATAINAGSLVDPPQHVVDSLIQILNDHGFVLDPRFEINPGKTWMGNIHLQVVYPDSNLPQDDFEALKDFIDRNMFNEIRKLGKDTNCPITWSFGVDENGNVTGGLDINEQYIEDGQDDDIEECSVVEGADYGGAYDIEPDQFFTKEEIVEFGNAVADRVSEELEETNSTFVLSDVYMDTPTLLHVEVTDNNMNYSADVVIDMRRIRKPRDLHKYETDAVTQIEDDYRIQNNIPLDAATHINASENLDPLQTRIFQFLDDCQGYTDYNQKIEDVSDEFGMSPDEAEGYVWDWTLNHDAEWHDTADQEDDDNIEEATVLGAEGVDDYPEPPESNEPEERESKEEIIIELDDDIVVEDDGDSVEFLRDPAFLDDEDEWTLEDEPMFQIDDGDSVYEHVMDLIIDSIPGEDGKYHIKGRLKLVYDVTLSYYYEGTSEEDQTTELNEDGSSSVYDKYQSEVMELDVTEI